MWRMLVNLFVPRGERIARQIIDHGSPEADAFWQDRSAQQPESVEECYAILDRTTAANIRRAAVRAHAGGEYEPWAIRARELAGYAGV
jgi:hypothetical protein